MLEKFRLKNFGVPFNRSKFDFTDIFDEWDARNRRYDL